MHSQQRLDKVFQVKNGFLLDELEPYFAEFVGSTGQPKTVTELLLSRTRLVDGKYFKKH
jgi:hypothetical protein